MFPMIITLALALIGPAAAPDTQRAAPTRVYVYTARGAGGVVTEEEQGRLDSVKDLSDAMRRDSKIALVADANQAQVLVEVTGREQRDAPGGGFGGKVLTQPVEMIVRIRVKFGEDQTEIKGVGGAHWGRAAKDAAERLRKWIARVAPHNRGSDNPPSTQTTVPVAYGRSPRASAATARPTSSGWPQRPSGIRPSAMRRS